MSDRAALTVDLELFGHTPAYRSATGTTDREDAGLEGVEFLLDAFDEHDCTATFFTVSSLAETHPELLREVVSRGHELASHTHSHRLLSELPRDERRVELGDSRTRLTEATGADVTGFRAPAFDISDDHFQLLSDTGYEYDSSVVPSRRIPGWYGGEHDVTRPCRATSVRSDAPADLDVLPVSTMPGLRLPLTGTWVRFFGGWYTRSGMRLLSRRGVAPVLYVHPWELVDLPRVEGVPSRVYWRTGEWMRRTVESILAEPMTFVTAREILEESP